MKLGEALKLRKSYFSSLSYLSNRISNNCVVQEGDTPAEDPNKLFEKYLTLSKELQELVSAVNHTNASITFQVKVGPEPQLVTMTQALAIRDQLDRDFKMIKQIVLEGVVSKSHYSRSEIKSVSVVDVNSYQTRADKIAEKLRKLDSLIQEQNWTHELENINELALSLA